MSGALYNLAAMTVASTGTGTITLGSAASINGVLYLSFAGAGVPTGQPVYYSINDVGQSEIGLGTYTTAGTTLTRGPITSTNANAAINMTAAAIVRITPPTSQFREVLTANRTYFVLTTGSDSNTGLANTAGGAFLTLQKAANVIATLDLQTFSVTVNVGAGTYTGTLSVSGPWLGSGAVSFVGDTTTPANVIISTTSANAITVSNGASLNVSGFKLVTTTSGSCLSSTYNGFLVIGGKMDFGACASAHVEATRGGVVAANQSIAYNITGSAVTHWTADDGAALVIQVVTITLTGTPAFSTAFASVFNSGSMLINANTFSGAATGVRASATLNGVIQTFGAGATYLPGSVAVSTATGGQYA